MAAQTAHLGERTRIEALEDGGDAERPGLPVPCAGEVRGGGAAAHAGAGHPRASARRVAPGCGGDADRPGRLYLAQGNHAEAEPLYARALASRSKCPGAQAPPRPPSGPAPTRVRAQLAGRLDGAETRVNRAAATAPRPARPRTRRRRPMHVRLVSVLLTGVGRVATGGRGRERAVATAADPAARRPACPAAVAAARVSCVAPISSASVLLAPAAGGERGFGRQPMGDAAATAPAPPPLSELLPRRRALPHGASLRSSGCSRMPSPLAPPSPPRPATSPRPRRRLDRGAARAGVGGPCPASPATCTTGRRAGPRDSPCCPCMPAAAGRRRAGRAWRARRPPPRARACSPTPRGGSGGGQRRRRRRLHGTARRLACRGGTPRPHGVRSGLRGGARGGAPHGARGGPRRPRHARRARRLVQAVDTDISAGLDDVHFDPSVPVDPADDLLFVAYENQADGDRLCIPRCSLDGSNCTHYKESFDKNGFPPSATVDVSGRRLLGGDAKH